VSSLAALHDRSGQRKYLNPEERLAFRRAIDRIADRRKRAFCLTLFHTGCRISEALALTGNKIDASEGTLIFRTLKQRSTVRHRAVPIPHALMEVLLECRADSDQSLFRFSRTTGWKIIKTAMREAELDGVKATPKGLRHGFAIASATVGIPLPKIQKWLGHEKLETTSIYLDYVGDDDRRLAERLWATTENTD
jgi:integrase